MTTDRLLTPHAVAIQRFTPRRIGLTFVLVAAVILVALAVNLNLRPLGLR